MSDSSKDINNEKKIVSDEESINSTGAADTAASVNIDNDSEDIEIISAADVTDSEDDILNAEDSEDSDKKPKKVSNIVRYTIMIVSICVFLYSFVNIVIIVYNYTHAQNIYNDVENDAASLSYDTQSYIDEEGNKYDNLTFSSLIDFDTLKTINGSVVGWVSVPSVNIEYPIVQASDNDYYLDHAINYETNYSGAIFLDYRNSADLSDPHMMIYGHHMQDGSMFAGLLEYDSEDFYKSNEGKNYFYIYTESNVRVYEIWSVCDVTFDKNAPAYSISSSVADYTAYVKPLELYSTGVTVDEDDQICTLYTCKTTSAAMVRQLLHGKLVAVIENTTE